LAGRSRLITQQSLSRLFSRVKAIHVSVEFMTWLLIDAADALVPRPRSNLIVYHGCLAPRAKAREQIVTYGRGKPPPEIDLHLSEDELFDEDPARITHRYYTWSELMLRVYGSDVLECPRCSSRLRFIQNVTEPLVVSALLASIGLSPQSPPRSERRGPMQLLLFPRSVLEFKALAPLATTVAGCRSPPRYANDSAHELCIKHFQPEIFGL
jgi:hypothetical protein